MLWIAFIFQYLWDTTQPRLQNRDMSFGCELLSFFSIFGIQHNLSFRNLLGCLVVKCFHFSVSLGYNTTFNDSFLLTCQLWIAFIFQYLWDTTQLIGDICNPLYCCELLSFFSIFGIQHNCSAYYCNCDGVVNCFHFSVSLGYNTTLVLNIANTFKLWIAFIFQYLWDTTQLSHFALNLMTRCELLSFFSIFGIQHNNNLFPDQTKIVVNCFHFSVSLGYNTTSRKRSENR